jgi:DNA-directed RNA polymerase subunit RPC12/RpoP
MNEQPSTTPNNNFFTTSPGLYPEVQTGTWPNTTYVYPTVRAYKCGKCHSEFQSPAQKYDEDNKLIQVCPFCGRPMKGLS